MANAAKIDALRSGRVVKPVDIFVISIIIISTIVVFVISIFWGGGKTVLVAVGGEKYTYSLDEDREIALESLTIVIDGGKVYVKDAKCPDLVCEKTGAIDASGGMIVCLPSGVVISITGDDGALHGST